MTVAKPASRPNVPHFSSGPCAKRPGWNPQNLKDAALGRSHRAKIGKAKLKLAIELTREVLEVPAGYRIGIVPASDTGAVEMALWSLLGARPVTTIAWESFGEGWVSDIVKELKLKDVTKLHAGYGEIPDLGKADPASDIVFTWNGTTSGVRVPNADWISATREGLTICDATSAAFAQPLDWAKLDVVTFSWQKALGGEAAHGMLVLQPRAVARLESYKPAWPLPKIFRMTKGGKLNEGIFEGETINTPSMLCVEDYLDALNWAKSVGGLKALIARADANTKVLADWKAKTPWIDFLAKDPAIRSNTSVCLKVRRSRDHLADGGCAGRFLQEAGRAGREGRRRLRLRVLPRCAGGPADLVRRHRGSNRRRAADAVDRLGVRRDQGALAEGGVDVHAHLSWPGLTCHPSKGWPAVLHATIRLSDLHASKRHRRVDRQRWRWTPALQGARKRASRWSRPAGVRSLTANASSINGYIQMSKPKVLISDALSPAAVQIFKDRGVEVDFQPNLGKDKDKLAEIIGNYDGLAIRSATKATAKIIEKATRLKVIGRAGIGVDNVEIPAATAKGIIVMNTPFGNSITTAEHAITLMLALAREIPQADASTQAGKWEKNRFMGVEITAKTLGVIGCGNIGSIVADRALGLRMKVIAFDPFLSPERAKDIGVEKVELDDLLKRADFITLHTPLTEKTRNIIDAGAIAKMKKGVRIINCARGGLVDEQALVDALNSKHVAGAAFDVFVEEPATSNVLFGHPNVICTPHLGAATTEAQENVALQVAEQMSDYLLTGAISNAVNFPSITAEEAPKLKPFIELAEKLGSFAGQLTESGILKVQITYEGHVAEMKIKAITSAVLSGLLRPMLGDVNVVSAPVVAKERGMVVDEIVRAAQSDYESLITVTVTTERQERSVSGTVYADGKPRLVDIKGIRVDAEFGKSMIYVTNEDKPGFIGSFAGLLGDAKINIATFHLGRIKQGGDAIALVEIDGAMPADVLAKVQALPQVKQAKALVF